MRIRSRDAGRAERFAGATAVRVLPDYASALADPRVDAVVSRCRRLSPRPCARGAAAGKHVLVRSLVSLIEYYRRWRRPATAAGRVVIVAKRSLQPLAVRLRACSRRTRSRHCVCALHHDRRRLKTADDLRNEALRRGAFFRGRHPLAAHAGSLVRASRRSPYRPSPSRKEPTAREDMMVAFRYDTARSGRCTTRARFHSLFRGCGCRS